MKALLLLLLFATSNCLAVDGRVIVKYRDTPTRQALDLSTSLSSRLGLALQAGRNIGARMQVLRASGLSSEDLAARLSSQSDVEYAVPDRLRTIRAVPNDPLFQASSTSSGQWYLQATTNATPAAIDAVDAWNQTTGSATVVVADIDTGVRYDHPDLAANLLPGADFIFNTANGGADDHPSTTDPAGSDPGDYISAADLKDSKLQTECGGGLSAQDSSWHGTRVLGILGALGNNGTGIAGAAWGVKLLPVRVLGKCGGYDSDIIAGMLWAAGISGTPEKGAAVNPNPAKVINLSLGGSGTCSGTAYPDAIAQLTAKGVLVVVAAGNETGPVDVPGNCAGVLAVAGVRNIGGKVGYSSFGPEVSVSAPAGNCVNSSGTCLYSIETTTNLGTTTPAANGYTDEIDYNVGTSFSSPQAAGVAALMLSLNPTLQPADLIARIKQSAHPFPVDNTLPTCPAYSTTGNTTGQCNCTTSTCGAGLLNAAAAVMAAAVQIVAIQTPATAVVGTPITLNGTNIQVAPGRSIVSYLWALVSAPAGVSITAASLASTNTPTTTLTAPAPGSYTVSLTVTDNLGASNTTQTSVQVAAATPASSSGGGAIDFPTLLGLACLAYLTRFRKT